MKIPLTVLAAATILAPLAGAFATTGAPDDEDAAARAWIVQARRAAKPAAWTGAAQAPIPSSSSADDASGASAALSDPFALQPRPAPSVAQARPSRGTLDEEDDDTIAPEQRIRLLATLLQEDAACAVLQIDGARYRVRPGDRLPGKLGRVLRIDEDALAFTGAEQAPHAVHTIRMTAPPKAGA